MAQDWEIERLRLAEGFGELLDTVRGAGVFPDLEWRVGYYLQACLWDDEGTGWR